MRKLLLAAILSLSPASALASGGNLRGHTLRPGESLRIAHVTSVRLHGHALARAIDTAPDSCGPVWDFKFRGQTVAEWDACTGTITVWAHRYGGRTVIVRGT